MTSTPDIPTDAQIEAAARGICKRRNTGQCAALCLSHLSLYTGKGQCPEVLIVWRQDAKAALIAAFQLSPSEEMRLKKKPVAFCVQTSDEILLFDDEEVASKNAEWRGVEYQGLYVRNRTPLSEPAGERGRVVEECAKVAEGYAGEEKTTEAEPDDGISLDSLAAGEAAGLIIANRIRAFSPPQPARPTRSVLDFNVVQPGYESSGAEPTLRMLVFKYYATHFNEADEATELAREYIRQLPNAEVDQPTEDELARVLHDNNYHPRPWDQAIEPYKSYAQSNARAVHAFLKSRSAASLDTRGKWQWVPKEPTQEMINAGCEADIPGGRYGEPTFRESTIDENDVPVIWRDMLLVASKIQS